MRRHAFSMQPAVFGDALVERFYPFETFSAVICSSRPGTITWAITP